MQQPAFLADRYGLIVRSVDHAPKELPIFLHMTGKDRVIGGYRGGQFKSSSFLEFGASVSVAIQVRRAAFLWEGSEC